MVNSVFKKNELVIWFKQGVASTSSNLFYFPCFIFSTKELSGRKKHFQSLNICVGSSTGCINSVFSSSWNAAVWARWQLDYNPTAVNLVAPTCPILLNVFLSNSSLCLQEQKKQHKKNHGVSLSKTMCGGLSSCQNSQPLSDEMPPLGTSGF